LKGRTTMTQIEIGQVAMIPLADIEVGDRARQEMGDLNEIEASMKEQGLISPLAVKQTDDGYFLLAGERRYLILQKNKVETVPVRIYPADISKFEMKAIELAENFHRKDMEYWEYDNLILEVHTLKQELHGIKAPGPDHHGWGMEDTAKISGSSKAAVSTAISRAEAREAFPELFEKCKTSSDASKVIKKVDEALVKEVIAKKLESSKQDSTFNQLANNFILGNFFDRVEAIPDGTMHFVEIDPPYAIGLKEAKKIEGVSKYDLTQYNEVPKSSFMDGDDKITNPWRGMNQVFKECYRVMADHSWLICWFGPEPWFEEIYRALVNADFNTTRMCGIWTKPSGQSKRPEIHLANSYEMFFYAWKGRPALNKAGRTNNFIYSPVPANQKTHPTEQPIELTTDIYNTFAFPGSRVLIPFLGSGNGIFSANDLGMTPIGFELGKGYRDSFLVKLHKRK
jgi:ParB-like chromosome segregation protein Spo0J